MNQKKNKNSYQRNRKDDKNKNAFIIGGRNAAIEALQSDREIAQIFIDSGLTGDFEKQVRKLSTEQNIPLKRVPKAFFNKYRNIHHQSILVELSPIKYTAIEDVFDRLQDKPQAQVLLLDKIKDVRNIGAIARSAKAFGVDAIILPSKNAAPINSYAVTASAGQLLHMTVARYPSQEDLLSLLERYGYSILSADRKGKTELRPEMLSDRVCLVLGSEESGINRELLRASKEWIKIDHDPSVESLNVSVAGGIILHDLYRMRKKQND